MTAGPGQLANEIANATQVFTDADNLQVGKPVHIQVVPGYSVAGGLESFTANLVNGVLQSAVDTVNVSVTYEVLDENQMPAAMGTWKAVPDIGQPGITSAPLQVKFFLTPIFTSDSAPVQVRHYTIRIKITVTVEGVSTDPPAKIDVPVPVPGIAVPSVCLLGKFPNWAVSNGSDEGSHLIVFVRGSATYFNVGAVLQEFNTLVTIVNELKGLVDFTSDLLPALGTAATAIDSLPVVDFVQPGPSAANLDDVSDFDGAGCILIIGFSGDPQGKPPEPVSVTVFKDAGFGSKHVNFTVPPSMANTTVPIGVFRNDDVSQVQYPDGSLIGDNVYSIKWGGWS